MRRIVYAFVVLVASSAPALGTANAHAQEPCAAVTTTDTVTSLVNEYVPACVPYDVPPDVSECVDRHVGASDTESVGTVGVDIEVSFCVPIPNP